MVATAISCTVQGLSGVPVTVEADVANGNPRFSLKPPARQLRNWRTKDPRVATFTLTPPTANARRHARRECLTLVWRDRR
jgi:hypothetical protein